MRSMNGGAPDAAGAHHHHHRQHPTTLPEGLACCAGTYGAACRLARLGVPVFPCRPNSKAPATPHGFQDATTNTARLEAWWGVSDGGETRPLNLAIATGRASGLWVVDLDGEEGLETLEALEAEHGPLPDTVTVATPSGGRHLYFRLPEGVEVRSRARVLPGVDVRGDGGYVLTPPSTVDGRHYRWLRLGEVAQAPGWLLEAVAHRHTPTQTAASSGGAALWCEGERNDRLFREGCALRRRGYTASEIEVALLALNAQRCDPPLDESEVRKIAHSAARYEPAKSPPGGNGTTRRHIHTVTAANVEPHPVQWLWEPRVPLGALTLLVGDPGAGKSMLTCWLAAQVTQQGGAVLMVSAEDHAAAVIRPRLEAAGAHLERVHIVRVRDGDTDDGLALPGDAPLLEHQVRAHGAQLVVIDPLGAHLDEQVNSWRDQSIRQALSPLARAAEATGCAVVVVAHLNKMRGTHPLYRVGGSIGTPAAARSVLLLARDPDDPEGDRRVLAHTKCNLGPLAPALALRIEPAQLGEVTTARVAIEGEVEVAVADLLDGDGPGDAGELERAEEFLREALSSGPLPAKTVLAEAREEGLSEKTVRRAAAKLDVQKRRVSHGNRGAGRWEWALPEGAPQDAPQDGQPPYIQHGHLANPASEKGFPQDGQPPYTHLGHLANGGPSPPAGVPPAHLRGCAAHVDPDAPDNGFRPGCRYCVTATERASSRDETAGGSL